MPDQARLEFEIYIHTTSAYWNLLSRATNLKARKPIGPLKRDDESLAVDDKEKTDLLNCFFATFRTKLTDTIKVAWRFAFVQNKQLVTNASVSKIYMIASAVQKEQMARLN